jgi:hypothetical protein
MGQFDHKFIENDGNWMDVNEVQPPVSFIHTSKNDVPFYVVDTK